MKPGSMKLMYETTRIINMDAIASGWSCSSTRAAQAGMAVGSAALMVGS